MMRTATLPLKLLSPAFLGDAQQKGVWRTPPIKALLREWWRVAEGNADFRDMREKEGALFGNAWLDAEKHCKSQVRLALEHWNPGKMTTLEDDPKVHHQEVGRQVGSQLYLGYGPITYDRESKRSALKHNAALQALETNILRLAWPEANNDELTRTLQLIHWFGTFGGRSRNGWGSLALLPSPASGARGEGAWQADPLFAAHPTLQAALHPLRDCMKLDWPHAIGQDGQGALVWESMEPFTDWKAAMTFLAKTKIGFRTALTFDGGRNHPQPQKRHLLAYPVTNHAVTMNGWGGNARLANQLRFKLFLDGDNHLRARIYHTPHKCPLPVGGIDELAVWQAVHLWLDDQNTLNRLGART